MSTRRRAARLLAAAGALLVGGPAAYAVTGSPPVTAPDHVTVRAAQPTPLDLPANDSDPDGDVVQVCRLGPLPRALAGSAVQNGQVFVFPGRRAHGTYTFTYYACDTASLTPGRVTLKVTRAATLDAVLVDSLPGKVKLVNTYRQRTFRCTWTTGRSGDRIAGRATVPPRSKVFVTIHDTEVEFDCESNHIGVGIGISVVGDVHTRTVHRR